MKKVCRRALFSLTKVIIYDNFKEWDLGGKRKR